MMEVGRNIHLELGAGAKFFSSNSASSSSSSMTRERLALALVGSVSWFTLAGAGAGAGAGATTATYFASTVTGVTPTLLPFAAAVPSEGFAAVAGVQAGAALEKKELRLVCPLTGANVLGGIVNVQCVEEPTKIVQSNLQLFSKKRTA
jgi:hypothetical protein